MWLQICFLTLFHVTPGCKTATHSIHSVKSRQINDGYKRLNQQTPNTHCLQQGVCQQRCYAMQNNQLHDNYAAQGLNLGTPIMAGGALCMPDVECELK